MEMTKNKSAVSKSAVRSTANALRGIVFEKQDNEFIGSEEDLIGRLGVSRPTLRQAAAIVCQEQWMRVKRGVGGGYFACRPDSRAVAHMAAVYLQAHHATLEQIVHAVWPIRVELARLAAKNLTSENRAQLEFLLAQEGESGSSFPAFLKKEREFGQALGLASGNQVLSLFLEILYDLSSRIPREEDIYADHPERVQEYRAKRNLLIAAVLSGDEEMAVLNARRIAERVTEWLLEGMADDQDGDARGPLNDWRTMVH